MKFLLIILTISLCTNVLFAQLSSGFNTNEAKDMIALCNSYTYLDLYGDDSGIIPAGYQKVYTSPTVGMDNKFQVYTKGKIGVINFRGSTDNKASWLENVDSAILPIEGEIVVQDKTFNYKFGNDTASGVHSGYALSMAFLHEEIIDQIKALNQRGIHHIIITGHSQGGALAVLTRAYLEHGAKRSISHKNVFKVYTFAQPMSGNRAFANEYNALFCATGMSYSLINPNDKVPSMPLSFNDTTFFRDNLMAMLSKDTDVDKSKLFQEGMILLFQDKLKGTVNRFGNSIHEQLEKELGEIELPKSKSEINYSQVGNIIHLPPPYYPLELKDSSILTNKEFLATHPRDDNGIFENKSVYKKVTMSQNHKPYNYYTAVLRKYFPDEYDAIEPKSFGL